MHRKREARDVADLGQVLDHNPVLGQRRADRIQERHLRGELAAIQRLHLLLHLGDVPPPGGPVERADLRRERVQGQGGVREQRHLRTRVAGDLDRVEVDADHLDRVVQPPVGLHPLEA